MKTTQDPIEKIREILPQEELLCQLAEEASELAQAALKLRRVYDGRNPTPKKRREAFDDFLEEIADVYLCLMVLEPHGAGNLTRIMRTANEKLLRWQNRLLETTCPVCGEYVPKESKACPNCLVHQIDPDSEFMGEYEEENYG